MRKVYLFLICVFISFNLSLDAQSKLIPTPKHITKERGSVKIESVDPIIASLSNAIKLVEDAGVPISKNGLPLKLSIVKSIKGVEQNIDEAYTLKIDKKTVEIAATTDVGLYWGLTTLNQLIEEYKGKNMPSLTITDWPSFKIRGLMQDVGRRYISIDELKRQILALSKYKMNVFHWHLTEHHAWRLESKLYPKLASADNMTRDKGGYYTQEEAKEIQEFCRDHNVILIPEIDMPGHSDAFIRAFGVDMQSKEGMKILKELISEACEVFDQVPYIHIGTDEVRFTNPTFCDEMVAFIRAKGKKVISWNPGWNYKEGEIDMTQMWSYRGKPTPGVPAIDSKLHYLNHFDVFADIVGLYTSKIANVDKGSDQIAGSIIAIWHDRFLPNEHSMAIENSLYPNLLALAERTWVGGGYQYFDDFGTNLIKGTEPFKDFENFEERMLWHKSRYFKDYPFAYVKQSDVEWQITEAFPNEGDLLKSFEPEKTLKMNYSYNGKTYGSKRATGSGIYLRHPWGEGTVKTFYESPKPNHTAYAWTYVYSPKSQEVGLWFETQNYSRSEKDLPPRAGTWDYKESKIWINDQLVAPPVWITSQTEQSSEIPLANENFVSRDPLPVKLNKGWNKVFIKLPVGKFSTPEVRLVKWMFAAAFVTMDGKDRPEGLIYSPDREM